jgi:hypothetical protein
MGKGNETKHNKKVPHSPHHDKEGQEQQLYADMFYEYEVCHMGSHHTKYRDPQGTKNFNSRVGPTGESEYHDENDGDFLSTSHYPNAQRHYNNTHSSHTDSNREKYAGGVQNKNTGGQVSSTTKQDEWKGASNNRVSLHSNEARIRSKSNFVNASDDGIHIQTSKGQSWNYHSKDVATTYGGNHYQISQGDHGIHVQKDGNLDYRVEKGKMQLQTGKGELQVKSGSTMNINAASKITIQVGGSSISIEGGEIKVKSSKITLDGESHIGGSGGTLAGTCGGGCASKTFVT